MFNNIAYIPQQYNPNKHPSMPDGYPWCVSHVSDDYIPKENETVLSEDEYSVYVSNIDLSDYNIALDKAAIEYRIKLYQSMANDLIIELYTKNILSGMSRQQSDMLFDELDDVLTRIKEGAFPTAIYRLQNKIPQGYVTQYMLDDWITTINSKLI
jgi:hypothetical protein